MYRKIMLVAAVSVAALLSPGASASELVGNGGFETGDFTDWTISGDPFYVGVDGNAPYEGSFGAYFGAPGTIDQTLVTIAGQQYKISFALQVEEDPLGVTAPNSFSAVFGGTTLYSVIDSPVTGYTLLTFFANATSNATTLSFNVSDQPAFIDLDAISVSATPEPATWATSILGFGLAGLTLRRRPTIRLAYAA